MKKQTLFVIAMLLAVVILFITCNPDEGRMEKEKYEASFRKNGVYENPEQYGQHLVTLMGCNDCHTPKRMGKFGPELDSVLMLSGRPAKRPLFDIDRKAMSGKGLTVTDDLTAWAGPWGVSFTANLTPDETGLAGWTLDQFKIAIRHGKYHGMENGRTLLPPMPWEMYKHMSDDEMAAVFAYLKTLTPINNLVPAPLPPTQ